MIDPKVD